MKSIFRSKTVWGAIASAIIGLFAIFDVRLSEADTAPVVEAFFVILTFGFTLYGRLKASVPVKLGRLSGDKIPMLLVAFLLIAVATVPQAGCKAYEDFAGKNPRAAQLIETAAHAAIIYAINDQAGKSATIAEHATALKAAANSAFAQGANEAEVARIIAESVFANFPDDAEAREILLAGLRDALADPTAPDGTPASDQERVQAALIRSHLPGAFARAN